MDIEIIDETRKQMPRDLWLVGVLRKSSGSLGGAFLRRVPQKQDGEGTKTSSRGWCKLVDMGQLTEYARSGAVHELGVDSRSSLRNMRTQEEYKVYRELGIEPLKDIAYFSSLPSFNYEDTLEVWEGCAPAKSWKLYDEFYDQSKAELWAWKAGLSISLTGVQIPWNGDYSKALVEGIVVCTRHLLKDGGRSAKKRGDLADLKDWAEWGGTTTVKLARNVVNRVWRLREFAEWYNEAVTTYGFGHVALDVRSAFYEHSMAYRAGLAGKTVFGYRKPRIESSELKDVNEALTLAMVAY